MKWIFTFLTVLILSALPACAVAAPGDVSFEIVDASVDRPTQSAGNFSAAVDVRVIVDGDMTIPAIGWSFEATVSPLPGAIGTVWFAPAQVQVGEPNLQPSTSVPFVDFDRDFGGMSYGTLGTTDSVIEATATYIAPLFSPPPLLDTYGNLQLPSESGLVSLPLSLSPDALGDFQISIVSDPLFNGVAYITPTSDIEFHPSGPHISGILTVEVRLLGDMDLDEDVDFDDVGPFVLALIDEAAYFDQYGVSPVMRGDIDGSGFHDFDDITGFVALLNSPLATGDLRAVPEPSTIFLAGLGLLVITARGWRRHRVTSSHAYAEPENLTQDVENYYRICFRNP